MGGVGHTGGLTTPAPGAEDAEPVILIAVGLPCLERGRRLQKKSRSPKYLKNGYTYDLAEVSIKFTRQF